MPIYEYESKAGLRVERYSNAVRPPKSIKLDGVRYGRIISQIAPPRVPSVEHTQIFKDDVGKKARLPMRGNKYVIRNSNDIREVEKASDGRLRYEPDVYAEQHRIDAGEATAISHAQADARKRRSAQG